MSVREIALLQCSPHRGGVTDQLADFFALGAQENGAPVRRIILRDLRVAPCCGCNACRQPPHQCGLDGRGDDAGAVFRLLEDCGLICACSPIYFYALPAGFKALIDRAQRFWWMGARGPRGPLRPAVCCLAAGRSRGEKLFSGALLCLRYFFDALGAAIIQCSLLGGLEDRGRIAESGADSAALELGRQAARLLLDGYGHRR